MRYYRFAAIAVLALAVVIFGGVAIATPSAPPTAVQAEYVTDASVVYVDTDRGHGSGVHIGDGYVLTAGHVADGAKTIQLKTAGGKFQPAEVLWLNKEYDIALLRTDGAGIGAATLSCRYAHTGEDIRAIGVFRARVQKDGRSVSLGNFPTAEDAHAAYVSAANDLYGEYARAA